MLNKMDPVHVQKSHFPMIHLNIILPIYAWVYQVVSLNQVSLPKHGIYD